MFTVKPRTTFTGKTQMLELFFIRGNYTKYVFEENMHILWVIEVRPT
jgi:hypothetical protein